MNIKEKFNKIADLLLAFKQEQEQFKIKTIKTKDGEELNVDNLAVDGIVTDADGNPVHAKDYELEDGTLVVVGEQGKITEIKQATEKSKTDETATEKPETEKSKTDETATEKPETDEPADDEPKTDETAKAVEDLTNRIIKIEALLNSMGIQLNELGEQFSKIDMTPAQAPVGQQLEENKKSENTSRFSSFKKIYNK